jgi:hypothetical protein
VIGLGTQDDLDDADDFLADTGVGSTFPMYWDETFESWRQLGVTSQPAAAVFGADGTLLDAWLGRIPEDRVVELISGS